MSDALRTALLAAADAVDAARAELGRLDGAAGDGDHGMTMSIGARNLRRRLGALDPDAAPDAILEAAARAMGDVGGAIGPLYAAALAAIASEMGAPAWSAASVVGRLCRAAERSERAVVDLGHAAPGDKTVVDALHPLADSLRKSEAAGAAPEVAIDAAVLAAEAGAAGTADMVARLGRASRLGERSRGLPDAGASSLAIMVRAAAGSRGGPGIGGR